ncbi:hypothetical protein BU24DRAFT_424224, partial [Aaosphaeria arxii CBS 175.79]
MDLMKKWIAGKLMKILGDEDDVVIETTYNLLEQHRYVRTFPITFTPIQLGFCVLLLTLFVTAKDQGDPNPARRVPRKGLRSILQGALEPHVECSVGQARRSEGTVGSEEAGIETRAG